MPVIALSLTEQIEKFGAYAGLAAFFGFAVLIVLTFAQARELKRLREWAGRAPERAAELEARVAADAARRAAARPAAPAAAPAATAAAPAAAAAGAAKPATAAAQQPAGAEAPTTVTPPATAGGEKPAETAAPAATATAPAPGEQATPGEGDGDGGDGPAKPDDGAAPAPAEKEPAPAGKEEAPATKEPATANGSGQAAPPIPRATPDPQRRPAPAPGRRPVPAAPLRQGGPATRRPAPPQRRPAPQPPAEDRGRGRMLLAVLGGLAALVVALLVVTQLFGGEDSAPQPEPNVPVQAEPTPEGDEPAGATPADTTVAVLNGTTVTGLAATIMDKITAEGYTQGKTDNYSDQARSASLVFYADGARDQAEDVAKLIDLPPSDVEAMTPDIEALAGPEAGVVVVVGNDQAQ